MLIKNLAIIPARSGSKGLVNKNILQIGGKSLIEIACENAEKSENIDKIFFSSDSKEYINLYKKLNLSKDVSHEYMRPEEISGDNSTVYEYVYDCINFLKNIDISVENIIILQVTSPLRTKKHIDTAFEIYNKSLKNSLVSVSECINHPSHIIIEKNVGEYVRIVDCELGNRQNYKKSYCLNGSIYIVNCSKYISEQKLNIEKSDIYIMGKIYGIDIDDNIDYEIAKNIFHYYADLC